LLRSSGFRDYQTSLDDEARTIGAAMTSREARERIAAFAARSAQGAGRGQEARN
jgi:2-(1,2-epoxy-1,2-dihydrophenyl)acetyl-CoA isomerase